jgi:hypothetical protein
MDESYEEINEHHLMKCSDPHLESANIYMCMDVICVMPDDEKVALEISIVKKRKYITSTHSINIDHLTEEEVDEFAKILYDKAVMLLINYYPQGQLKKETSK